MDLLLMNQGSLEAPKGFPAAGPADGKIASANGSIGGDTTLDIQTADRWKKPIFPLGECLYLEILGVPCDSEMALLYDKAGLESQSAAFPP